MYASMTGCVYVLGKLAPSNRKQGLHKCYTCGLHEISSGCAHCDDKHKCDANMHVGIVHTGNVCCRLWQECLGMYASMTACMYGLCNLLLQIANKVSGRSVVHVPGLKSQGIVRIVTTNSSVMRSCTWELFTQAMCGADSGRND